MTIQINDDDLTEAALRYHGAMVDADQYTVGEVREGLASYLRETVRYFVDNVTEFEFERPDQLEAALQATKQH